MHAYVCCKGSLMGSPRARAYFAPLPHWQHPALIALSSLFLAMLTLVMAAATGLFSWRIASSAFEEDWGLCLACSLLVILKGWYPGRSTQLQPVNAAGLLLGPGKL